MFMDVNFDKMSLQFNALVRCYQKLEGAMGCDDPTMKILSDVIKEMRRDTKINDYFCYAWKNDHTKNVHLVFPRVRIDEGSPDNVSYEFESFIVTPDNQTIMLEFHTYCGYIDIDTMLRDLRYDVDCATDLSVNEDVFDEYDKDEPHFSYDDLISLLV